MKNENESGQLTLFAGDSPASPSAMPDEEQERKMIAISGLKCSELLMNHGPAGSLVKMLLASSRWWNPYCNLKWSAENLIDTRKLIITKRYTHKRKECYSKSSVKTSKPSVMKYGRLLFRLRVSKRATAATGFGLLGTPRVTTNGGHGYVREDCKSRMEDQIATAMLRTPNASDLQGRGEYKNLEKLRKKHEAGHQVNLSEQIRLIKTPSAMDERSEGMKPMGDSGSTGTLAQQMKYRTGAFEMLIPTPTKRCWKDTPGMSYEGKDGRKRLDETGRAIGASTGLKLQSRFVEWMMDFPEGWTDIGETD